MPSVGIKLATLNSSIRTSANIRELGVYLDSTMSMTIHVTRICRTAYGRLCKTARIRSSLLLRACKTLVHALVTSQSLAAVPRINLERYGRRAFSCAGPSLWNALPLGLRTQQDPDHFRRDLKTHLFNVFSK